MNRKMMILTGGLLLAMMISATPNLRAQKDVIHDDLTDTAARAPRIEVCFVLDTTGSMGGLIAGAKAKIWSIANQLVAAEPTPELKIALVGYRDRGDEYVTRVFDLSDDIDRVYARLQEFQANGGGDTPESVNQALHETLTRISWSPDREVLKVVFLVGDCPPHMDYQDDVPYQETCRAAVFRDLVINSVQCGGHAETTPVWQEISRLAEGRFVALSQSGDMAVIDAPQDRRLAELNVELGATLMAYGGAEAEKEVRAKQAYAEAAEAPAVADRLAYNSATGKVVQGGGDLVEDLAAGRVKLEDLDEEELPQTIKGLKPAEQEVYLAEQGKKREAVQSEIDKLLAEREAYISAETKKRIESGQGSAFDLEVARIIREQGRKKGILYGPTP
jgi:Mg-chelatase subunit ChlD